MNEAMDCPADAVADTNPDELLLTSRFKTSIGEIPVDIDDGLFVPAAWY